MAAVRKSVTFITATPSQRFLGVWIVLLGLAQIADLVTTQADMARGGMEANRFAAALIAIGGLSLLWLVKLALVAAMAAAVLLVHRYWLSSGADRRAAVAQAVIWRSTQLCVLVLAATAVHNVQVLTQISQ